MHTAFPLPTRLSAQQSRPMPSFSVPSVALYVLRHIWLARSDKKQQKWGTGSVRPEQGLLKLRKEMGTFGNLRPCFFASDSLIEGSPLKAEVCRGVNINIVRELTGGIYFGDRIEDDGSGYAMDTEPYSRPEIERITRLAANLALAENPPAPVWSLDKANVLATSRLWRKVVTEVMEKEFPQLQIGHQLIDSAAMIPRALNGVVVTSNLFGDIISDEASVIPGSLGLLPSASLSGVPDGKSKCNGIYEPIHGMLLQSLFPYFN
jgi:3-isopropylmalate dehydrogenase